MIQRDHPIFGTFFKPGPAADMLFRPEEIHGRSGIGNIFEPFTEWYRYISHQPWWLRLEDFTILHFHLDGLPTIQTRCVNLHLFSGKQPANCQRLKTSLAEPFLLTVDGDAILGGKIVKRCKGSNEIRIRE
jgi:hypothetical protein